MKDMADLKAKLKDQNQRLIQVTQDKARVSSLFIYLEKQVIVIFSDLENGLILSIFSFSVGG